MPAKSSMEDSESFGSPVKTGPQATHANSAGQAHPEGLRPLASLSFLAMGHCLNWRISHSPLKEAGLRRRECSHKQCWHRAVEQPATRQSTAKRVCGDDTHCITCRDLPGLVPRPLERCWLHWPRHPQAPLVRVELGRILDVWGLGQPIGSELRQKVQ